MIGPNKLKQLPNITKLVARTSTIAADLRSGNHTAFSVRHPSICVLGSSVRALCSSDGWLQQMLRLGSPPRAEVTARFAESDNSSEEVEASGEAAESQWLGALQSLPSDCLQSVLHLLSPRELCAVACCSRILRPLAESDANWRRLFAARFPRLVLIMGRAQPEWWCGSGGGGNCGATWRQRYAALSSGAPFHAQVFNREQDNDQEDFMLSCYDATLRLTTPVTAASEGAEPTFCASYPAMGRMPVVHEHGITQRRLRAAPVHCPPQAVFGGDGQTTSLCEGDEVEVQWKGRRSHPFGWWFGRVQSVHEGRVTLEFMQYPPSSVWRRVKAPVRLGEEAMVNGDTTFGFVGGLRRLEPEEVEEWCQHCPPHRMWRGVEVEARRDEIDAADAVEMAAAAFAAAANQGAGAGMEDGGAVQPIGDTTGMLAVHTQAAPGAAAAAEGQQGHAEGAAAATVFSAAPQLQALANAVAAALAAASAVQTAADISNSTAPAPHLPAAAAAAVAALASPRLASGSAVGAARGPAVTTPVSSPLKVGGLNGRGQLQH